MPKVGFWKRLRDSIFFWRNGIGPLSGVVAVMALPLSLQGLSSGGEASAYTSLASLFMGLAVVWSVGRLRREQTVSIKSAYYEGTAPIIKYMLVLLVLALQALPFLAAASAYSLGLAGAASLAEKLVLGALGLLLALPTLYWLPRYALAILWVHETQPLAALRASKQLVDGKYWLVLANLLLFTLVCVAALILPTILLAMAYQATGQEIYMIILQLLSTLVLMPLGIIFLSQLRDDLA